MKINIASSLKKGIEIPDIQVPILLGKNQIHVNLVVNKQYFLTNDNKRLKFFITIKIVNKTFNSRQPHQFTNISMWPTS